MPQSRQSSGTSPDDGNFLTCRHCKGQITYFWAIMTQTSTLGANIAWQIKISELDRRVPCIQFFTVSHQLIRFSDRLKNRVFCKYSRCTLNTHTKSVEHCVKFSIVSRKFMKWPCRAVSACCFTCCGWPSTHQGWKLQTLGYAQQLAQNLDWTENASPLMIETFKSFA